MLTAMKINNIPTNKNPLTAKCLFEKSSEKCLIREPTSYSENGLQLVDFPNKHFAVGEFFG